MSKRGRVELIVLLAIVVVGVIGTLYLIKGTPSTGMGAYAPSPGVVFKSNNIVVPPQVNPSDQLYIGLPYSSRLSPRQPYAPGYLNPGDERMAMYHCQTFCFGRPGYLPQDEYPKEERGGEKLAGCIAECLEQRMGIEDTASRVKYYGNPVPDSYYIEKLGLGSAD